MAFRLLADENTSHRLVSACRRLVPEFPLVHIANWEGGIWLGLDDAALLICCAETQLIWWHLIAPRSPGMRGNCFAPGKTMAD